MKRLVTYETQAGKVVEDWTETDDGMHDRETLPGQASFLDRGEVDVRGVVDRPKQGGLFEWAFRDIKH